MERIEQPDLKCGKEQEPRRAGLWNACVPALWPLEETAKQNGRQKVERKGSATITDPVPQESFIFFHLILNKVDNIQCEMWGFNERGQSGEICLTQATQIT